MQYFKVFFVSTKKKEKKKGEAATNIEAQFMNSGTGNLSNPVPLMGPHKYKVRGHSQGEKDYTMYKRGRLFPTFLMYPIRNISCWT